MICGERRVRPRGDRADVPLSWHVPKSKVRRYQEIVRRNGWIGASPCRIDAVSFSMATRQGLWSAQTLI